MKESEILEETAQRILNGSAEPVVRFRLLRDVLKAKVRSDMLVHARQEMLKTRWALELSNGQRRDGGWGRFHSAVGSRGGLWTTEAAVERGIALGLEATDPTFQATTKYLTELLEGRVEFPDPPEKNNRWSTGTRLFVAATLARIIPTHRTLDDVWKLWVEIAERAFASGKYDSEAEIRAHAELTGASVKDSYLVLNNKYQLALLGSRAEKLSKDLENAIVDWVWHKDNAVGYLEIPLSNPPVRYTASALDRLLTSLELLSRFPSWHNYAGKLIDSLWTQRNAEGLWDFGPRASMSVYFPLSESWRKTKYRQHDWSTRILALLGNFYDNGESSPLRKWRPGRDLDPGPAGDSR